MALFVCLSEKIRRESHKGREAKREREREKERQSERERERERERQREKGKWLAANNNLSLEFDLPVKMLRRMSE